MGTLSGRRPRFALRPLLFSARSSLIDWTRTMLKRTLAIALGAMLGGALQPALAEDLLQIYREAVANDPTLASARASWEATREVVPQARAGLLPSVTLSANANRQNVYEKLHTDPSLSGTENFPAYNYSVSASQPLYRRQNLVALDQAKQTLGQSDYVLASARQDLIVRVAQAYLDVLLARFNIELTESQKAAVSENLAQAKRNFEVGTATITDTNDAQAKYDQIVAQEISTTRSRRCARSSGARRRSSSVSAAGSSRNCRRPARSTPGSTRRYATIPKCASLRPTTTSRCSKSTGSARATTRRSTWWRASIRATPGPRHRWARASPTPPTIRIAG